MQLLEIDPPVTALVRFRSVVAAAKPPRFSLVLALDYPFGVALLEKIHPNKLTADIFSVAGPLFLDSGTGHGNIAEHMNVHRPKFKRLKFVVAGLKIA